jgi:hypothetical protein
VNRGRNYMRWKALFNWNPINLIAPHGLPNRPTQDKMEILRNWHSEVARARTGL